MRNCEESWGRTGAFAITTTTFAAITLLVLSCGDGAVEPTPPDPPRPTSVTVTPPTAELSALGATTRLSAQVRDQNGRVMAGAAVAWSSSNAQVAFVDASGLVTAAANGAATITATSGLASGTAAVTVAQEVSAVAVVPATDTLVVTDTVRLSAEATDANGHAVAGAEFAWASSDAPVAVVDGGGLVTGVAAGEAEITATSSGVTGRAAIIVAAAVHEGDRAAIVALYEATGGPNWTKSDNWLTDAPLDQWFGVQVDQQTGRVTGLRLPKNNLSGPIPPELWSLTALTHLDLENWRSLLTGSIPPEVGNLKDLTYLNLINNWLTGPIPVELSSLSLERLRLRGNRLTGPIPTELGNLASLTELGLGGNDLSGTIPTELGNLASLTLLDLGRNNLVGPIPTELGRLGNLWYLGLHLNQLAGEIPAALGNLSKLQRLFFFDNRLTGGIPTELGNLGNLERLSFESNNLSGGIPTELGNLTGLTDLRLNDNDLTGSIPAGFLGLNRLDRLFFDANGGLCAPGTSDFNTWLSGIEDVQGPYCNELDQKVLERLHETSGGPNWTNSGGWLQSPVLDEWHGVTADALGRVVTLDLTRNGLTGELRADLGSLAEMTALRIGGNALSGRLPLSLTRLALTELQYSNTSLCAPADAAFRTWLSGVASHDGTGVACAGLTDREILEVLYHATDGPSWTRSDNWLTDAPLADWYEVETDDSGRVTRLFLGRNGLHGMIPPEFGDLSRLNLLWLHSNELSGPIPPELGRLSRLRSLRLIGNALTGPIPPELGRLSRLQILRLEGNALTGPIPPELGNLQSLMWLMLFGNALTGPIPPELGRLSRLQILRLDDNALSGLLPPELGRLSQLKDLNLSRNAFTGTIPSEYGALAALEDLSVGGNAGMSGVLPASLTALRRLETFVASGTGLCAPPEDEFIDWLRGVPASRVRVCSENGGSVAYLTQAVQSRDFPVPLLAGEEALLRVFVTAPSATSANLPPVRASFYVNGAEARVVNIPGRSSSIPVEVDEGDLSKSLNALVPAGIVQPGLEMVIEIDPEGTLDSGLGVTKRIPATGRQAVEVREMPLLDLTLVPFLWTENPDSAVIDAVESAARDPGGDALLRYIRTLMPVGGLAVTAHAPVLTDTNNGSELLVATEAIRVMEGGSGHYMGTMSGATTGPLGVALGLGSKSAYSRPAAQIMAHELGHNFSLGHAPCGVTGGLDPHYPYSDGSVGVWGYDFEAGGRLISPFEYDVMTYCGGEWISDYNFTKAFRYRLADEGQPATAAATAKGQSLLLWGSADSTGIPNLKPAFVVHAQPALPDSTGPYRITGRAATGAELFSLAFTMPEVADGDGRSSFAFVLPTRPDWEGNLASITLSGPGGSATLDDGSDVPMAILRDPRTGQVRGFLRDLPLPTQAAMDAAEQFAGPGLEVLFSRGIPGADAWRR